MGNVKDNYSQGTTGEKRIDPKKFYTIFASYKGGAKEEIDSCTGEDLDYMMGEYRLAYQGQGMSLSYEESVEEAEDDE